MERRDFLKKSIKAGLLSSAAISFGGISNLFSFPNNSQNSKFDLVAIRGGEPDAMFDKAISSLGGMKSFVKKGQKVVVKPNIGWDVSPDRGANTNPALVRRIIEHCFEAGAKDVFVFDNTCDNWKRSYSNSGIEKAVRDAGGKIVSGASESYYQKVDVKSGKRLTSTTVHELIL
ncbi:MAG TPA: DUF362 domain-containing protein, partial [Ignavibacteriaceae bacterium]|nr:DUF362 domain-containing protein [Ignavibacteriaceae bacterium]